MLNTWNEALQYYREMGDTPITHSYIFRSFFELVNIDPELKKHRDIVEQQNLGYGDRPYTFLWKLIVEQLPVGFKFLEIGIFKGATISLVSLLNKRYNKNGQIYGITPLNPSDDEFSKHDPNCNYEECIQMQYYLNGLDLKDTTIIEGLSNDPKVLETTFKLIDGLDALYIDGNHDYPVVVNDIRQYTPLLKSGGLLVMDDACLDLQIPDGLIRMNWKGMESVTKAVREELHSNENFEFIFSCGHNKVFRKK